MIICSGKSVLNGVAIGKIYLYKKQEYVLEQTQVEDVEAEIARFEAAKEKATQELDALYQKALTEAGEEQAMIFDVHKMMLDDGDYLDSIRGMIRDEKVNAEYAVSATGDSFSAVFASMDDEYMKARSVDVLDISKRVVNVLAGIVEGGIASEVPVILLADDLSPSETVQLDKSKILAFVTKNGSANSHTAILARSMNIPALVKTDVALLEEYNGIQAVVDGIDGTFIINPDEETTQKMIRKKMDYEKERTELQKLIGKDNVTTDGRRINVYANIGNTQDVEKVLANDAGGIGLFRSEFIYLGRNDYPTEEEQFEIYKEVLSRMGGKKVIIRTLDIGADKQVDYFELPKEENPAMGYRAIRICLDRVNIFKTQLRAIYRASAFGTAAIMFPMIISVSEIRRIKEIVEEVKAELTREGISFNRVELGIMVETPAAVMISEELAKEVEFFSIGTNDLTQYTLAIDRQNQSLDNIYDSHHPAVLRMIQMTIENGHKGGAWVGICGELGSDTTLTKTFIDMGIDELSVSPTYVLGLRKAIREI
ncbi:MAG TPA: phosphoenolpyruvate--protein phosphotransferase [Candidatus Eisenbergiella merdigallinarum]|uniref:Phosphoenolpyruvate-protein phosphotransferase n=1 Tax=Candidatus Eisenbergiella merdigallinarum TaxID=2838552 RepID=A0A9D2MRG3_9FIRM|nr:phosphoenolpyruvate--protein phosphotransferase [Candidatus Eisenbergiella merdigallinarum]